VKGARKHRENRRFSIADRRVSIDRFASTLTSFDSVIAAPRPARPIVARCAFPDLTEIKVACAARHRPADAKDPAVSACEARSGLTAA